MSEIDCPDCNTLSKIDPEDTKLDTRKKVAMAAMLDENGMCPICKVVYVTTVTETKDGRETSIVRK